MSALVQKKRHVEDPNCRGRTLCGRRLSGHMALVEKGFHWVDPSTCVTCSRNSDVTPHLETKPLNIEQNVSLRLALGLDPGGLDRFAVWFKRHELAVLRPRGPEIGIVGLITAWATYAISHRAMHEAPIGNDQVIGKAWEKMGRELLVLLNAELDRLDGGQLDAGIRAFAKHEGVELE